MKKLIVLIVCIFLVGCGSTKEEIKKESPINKEDLTLSEFQEYFLVINTLHNENLLYTDITPSNYKITNKDNEVSIMYKLNDISVAETYNNTEKKLVWYSLIDWSKSYEIDRLATMIIFHYCNTTFDDIDEIKNSEEKNSQYNLGNCVISKSTNDIYSYTISIK